MLSISDSEMDRQMDRQADGHTGRLAVRGTDRQIRTNREMDRQTK